MRGYGIYIYIFGPNSDILQQLKISVLWKEAQRAFCYDTSIFLGLTGLPKFSWTSPHCPHFFPPPPGLVLLSCVSSQKSCNLAYYSWNTKSIWNKDKKWLCSTNNNTRQNSPESAITIIIFSLADQWSIVQLHDLTSRNSCLITHLSVLANPHQIKNSSVLKKN